MRRRRTGRSRRGRMRRRRKRRRRRSRRRRTSLRTRISCKTHKKIVWFQNQMCSRMKNSQQSVHCALPAYTEHCFVMQRALQKGHELPVGLPKQ